MAIFRLLFLLSFSLFITCASAEQIKDFTLKSYDSKTEIKLSDIKGPAYTLFNFWATWCVACIKELPELEELKQKNKDVNFVAINAGEDQKKIKKFLKKHTFTYRILLDESKSYTKSIGVLELPHTIVINSNGEVVYSNHRPPKSFNFDK